VSLLDRGALGPLFAAHAASGGEEGRLVAVRRIPIDACARQDVERLVETAKIARRVRHSKLAAVLDVVVTDREIALVGEHVDGHSLSSLQRLAIAKRSPLPPAVALRIGLEMLHALRAVRETWKAVAPPGAGPAPRGGISPYNLFVAAFGDVLLAEIGVSSVASTLGPFRALPGILAYRAPEQTRGDGAQSVDERADIFSVGVVLWELLANRLLFGDSERLEAPPDAKNPGLSDRTLRDVQSKLIAPLGSTERSGAPIARAVVDIVERALRRDPATRFTGIDQMLGALLALSRDVLASTEQVREAIQPLAGAEIAAQRATLGSFSSVPPAPPSGSTPDSGRPTLRPLAGKVPAAAASANAADRPAPAEEPFSPQAPPFEQFSQHEAPTYPTAQPASAAPQPATAPPDPPAQRSLPRLPKPPLRNPRAPSTPPPPPVRAKASSIPPPSSSAVLGAFGDPLPPLPELPEAAPPAPTPAAIAAQAAAFAATTEDSAAAAALAPRPSGAPNRQRARRLALALGGAVGLIGLLGLLIALLRPAPGNDSVARPHAAETAAAAARPVPKPAETVTQAPPGRSAAPQAEATSATAPQENPPRAPTKALPNVSETPPAAPPREGDRRPETRPEKERKPFRPRGI
jgi:eukaryotic-like serine/threonine-protein kinase